MLAMKIPLAMRARTHRTKPMNPPSLNKWQRANMRAFALSYRFVCPAPGSLAQAMRHRELSFTDRPMWLRTKRANEATKDI